MKGNEQLENMISKIENDLRVKLKNTLKVNTVMTHRDIGNVPPEV